MHTSGNPSADGSGGPGTSVSGKFCLVVGGSSGIGAATAHAIAQEGGRVAVGYHSGERRAAELMMQLPGSGHTTVKVGLADTESVKLAADVVGREFGKLDILVNSGGYTKKIPHGDLKLLTDALFDEMLAVHLRGAFALVREFLPLLRMARPSVVVNVSSIAASTAAGSNLAYCAAKAGLDNLTMSLARALGPDVRILGVSPAFVNTDFVPDQSAEDKRKKAEASPLGVLCTPEDVASAILACVTHLRMSTGSQIVVDGGRRLI